MIPLQVQNVQVHQHKKFVRVLGGRDMYSPQKTNEPAQTPGDRVRIARKDHNITQEKLAELLDCSVETISKIERGKRGLRQEKAKKIANLLNVQEGWLLCISNYKTKEDEISAAISRSLSESNRQGKRLRNGTDAFASLCGYDIVPPDLDSSQGIEGLLSSIKNGYQISKGTMSISLSVEEMNRFENEISDLVELKFKHLFAQKGVQLDG